MQKFLINKDEDHEFTTITRDYLKRRKIFYGNYFKVNFNFLFDGIITDIPYKGSILKKFEEEKFSFIKFLRKTDKETKKNSFLITFTNFLCAIDLVNFSKKTNWRYHTLQIWDKQPVRNWISWGHPLRHTKFILYLKKGDFKYCFKNGIVKKPYNRTSFGGKLKETKKNSNSKSYGMFSEIIHVNSPQKKIHPAEKPKYFSSYFASLIGNSNFLILDPFCGTGNLIKSFPNSLGIDIKNWNV